MGTWTPVIGRINEAGIDCSYRQFDYWCRQGLFGHDMYGDKPGWRRDITTADLEVLYALTEIRKVTRSISLVEIAAAVRARPVLPYGEVLVVEADGTAHRFDHWCGVADELATPVCVIPLRSFAAVPPAGSDDSAVDLQQPAEQGAAVSAAAAAPSPS